MPVSDGVIIPWVINLARLTQPQTVLDVGVGFGKWGMLFREMFDICHERYEKKDWKTRIDGVEVFTPYITSVHNYIYNNLYLEDVRDFVPTIDYDLVYFGDVLEHLEKKQALELVERFRKNSHVLISTPNGHFKQEKVFGNPYEEHKCGFFAKDFEKFSPKIYKLEHMMVVAVKCLKKSKKLLSN